MTNDGERIRKWRQMLGMSVRELAEQSGLHRTTIDNAERGENIRQVNLSKIYATLGRLSDQAGVTPPPEGSSPRAELEFVLFNVLADHSSDMDWIDKVGIELADALTRSGLLK